MKTVSQEDNLTGRQTHRKTTSQAEQEDNLKRGQPDKLAVKVCISLAQLSPSLFFDFFLTLCHFVSLCQFMFDYDDCIIFATITYMAAFFSHKSKV